MKIFIIGFMGSGKTTNARLLAAQTRTTMLDLDDYIAQQAQMSISDIFAKYGEAYFRQLETNCLQQVIALPQPLVIATGGGTPCYANNMQMMNQTGCTLYLRANIHLLARRLWDADARNQRPLLHNCHSLADCTKTIQMLFNTRKPYYEQAHYTANSNLPPQKIVAQIQAYIAHWQQHAQI